MDQDMSPSCGGPNPRDPDPRDPWETGRRRLISRRTAIAGGGALCLGGAAAAWYFLRGGMQRLIDRVRTAAADTVFKGGAPDDMLWELWQQRGWAKQASHYLKLGENVECRLCPNECVLEPEDRGRCRNRVYKDGELYSMAYGNPCAAQVDPIEKKPLFHFLPRSGAYSIATSGCGFRCLNCQNWDISQRKPEELKDPRGQKIRISPRHSRLTPEMSMFPEDVVAMVRFWGCSSIAYTYSEPTVWYEYMVDTAKAARQEGIKNVWVTCGYIQQEPLLELCKVIDGANVDLKSFDQQIYKTLNTGKLEPILQTLKTLKREDVWFEVTNLVVPTYTDDVEMIRRMCDWLVENLGPDYPLHFSRFHPQHKLTHLPITPVEDLQQARSIARDAGLNYVYIGNCADPELDHPETTFCPNPGCKRPLIVRDFYEVRTLELKDGRCIHCGSRIAGVWSE